MTSSLNDFFFALPYSSYRCVSGSAHVRLLQLMLGTTGVIIASQQGPDLLL